MAEALYRKYRPQVFEDVVGQEHIERTIKNAIESDRVSHAYLFCGPRGTGKTTTARLLAKALLCQKGPTPEPDGTCEDCEMIAAGEHPDVYELDAASRTGVENVREEIIGRVQFAPTRGRYKIYIIDEVHMLSTAAFNALLKTLEEPPSHVVFILATTDPQKVPETIHSRCQRFDFHRISHESIVSRLGAICVAEGVDFEGEALDLITHRADGGMRNALTSLEQLIAFGDGKVTLEVAERMLGSLASNDLAEIVRFVGERDVASCFRWTAEFVETGADLAQFTRDLAEHMRNMYVMSLAGADVALDISAAARRELTDELALFGSERLARIMGVLGDLGVELKTSTNPRLSFEIALTRMVRPQGDLTLEALAERVEELERRGVAVLAAGGSAAGAGAGGVAGTGAGGVADIQSLEQSCSHESSTGAFSSCGTRFVDASDPACREENGQRPVSRQGTEQVQPQRPKGEEFEARPETRFEPQAEPAPDSTSAPAQQLAPVGGGSVSVEFAASMRNPAALQRMWQTALVGLKKAKAAYGVLFLNTKASFDEAAGALIIEFPAENDFAFKAVQKPDVQDELAAAIAQAAGASVPFRLMQAGGTAKAPVMAGSTSVASAAGSAAAAGAVQAARAQVQMQASDRAQAQMSAQARPQAQATQSQAQAQRSSQQAQAPVQFNRAQQSQQQPQSRMQQAQQTQAVTRAQVQPQAAYDEVPVDLYDDMAGYGDYDEPGYYEDFAPQPQQAAPAQQVAPAQQTAAAQRMAQGAMQPAKAVAAPQPTQANVAPRAASAPSAAENDIEAALAFGFGDGIVFTEVRD